MIPVICCEGDSLPEVWENSFLSVWEKGINIKTEYDKDSTEYSKDCSMILVIKEPFKEPRLHRGLPCGLEDLEVYKLEVLEGIHDNWINPEEGKWAYTYHERLFNYNGFDQISEMINKLSKNYFSRRAQAITWKVDKDNFLSDPPCLQRIWCRVSQNEKGELFLNLNAHWRSRDAFKAAFMNIYVLTELQKIISERLSENLKTFVKVGRYVDISDSYHIYGSYFAEFERFLKLVRERDFKDRTWDTSFAIPFFKSALDKIKK